MVYNIIFLIKKNIINEIRSWRSFLFEVLVIIFLILALNPIKVEFEDMKPEELLNTEFHSNTGDVESLSHFRKFAKDGDKKYKILYTPDSKAAREIIKGVSTTFELEDPESYSMKDDMIKLFDEEHDLAAVSFDIVTDEKLDVGIHFPSQFRTITGDMCESTLNCSWLTRCLGVYEYNSSDKTMPVFDIYDAEGFLPLQHQIFKEWIKVYNATNYARFPAMKINSFYPHLAVPITLCFERVFHNFVQLFYHFIFFLPFLNFLRRVSRELEEDMPRHYSVYGFSRDHHWIAHLFTGFLHLLIFDGMLWKMLAYELPSKPEGIKVSFLLFLLFYHIILLLNVFVIATLVRTAKICVLVGASWWLVSYCIFSEVLTNKTEFDLGVMGILVIFTNNFMSFGMAFYSSEFVDKIWDMLAFQIFVILVYVIALKCAEHIRWGEWIRNDWVKKRDQKKSHENSNNHKNQGFKWSFFEYGPVEGHFLVLESVCVYENDNLDKEIIKNISMKFFKNEISVLVGPRNSGKTTLITILAGWQRYQGQIYFEDGKEVTENSTYYRQNIDVSMDKYAQSHLFTIKEQLRYVICIKTPGCTSAERSLEYDKWLLLLKPFITETGKYVHTMNYDQKRLLSLCCLLCGKRNSSIILLDEPTRYMTCEAQRAYWRILRQEKLNRLIIITSDSIEEAEAIGDRIGILYNGSLMAWGTSFYLRSNVSKEVYAVMFTTSTTSVTAISKLLESYVADIKLHNQFEDRIVYKFPSDKKPMYQKMLLELEKEFASLGIQRVYVTSGELYDVYGKLTSEKCHKSLSHYQNKSLPVFRVPESLRPSVTYQISALFYKKLLYQAPHYVPVAIVMLAIFLIIPVIAGLIRNEAKYPGILLKSDAAAEMAFLLTFFTINMEFGLSFLGISPVRTLSFWGLVIGHLSTEEGRSVWINELVLHSAGKLLNLAHNVMLQDFYGNGTNVVMIVRNEPIPIPNEDITSLMLMDKLKVALTFGIIMPLTMSSFILALIDERRNNIDVLQRIAGVKAKYFWLTHFAWDYIVYWIIVILLFLTLSVYTLHEFTTGAILVSLVVLAFYGIAYLSLVYVMFLRGGDHKWRSFFQLFISQLVLGIAAFLFYRKVAYDNAFLYYIFILSPTFAMISGMANISVHNSVHAVCIKRCNSIKDCNVDNACNLVKQCCYNSYFHWSFPGILQPICFLLITTIILAFIFFRTIINRNREKYSTTSRIKSLTSACYAYEAQSVIEEKVRISNLEIGECKEYAVLADQLEYEIPKDELRVKAISFALDYYKCMGIYGPFGSGKSHMIKQLIGSIPIRFGEVYICGYKCKTETCNVLRKLGYSPEENGYIDGATTRQLLTLFLRLNGIPASECYGQLQDISHRLNLRQYMNTRISELPLHIKRRINIAIALVLRKKVLIFDEPTRGMPFTEINYMRSVIRQARRQGNAVILVSEDSRELEELTDFIIMVDNGEMLAIGSVHNIRQLYTLGFYMEIKLYTDAATLEEIENNLREDIENLHRFIHFLHGNSELVIRRGTVLKFYLPIPTIFYSFLFGTMEKNRQRLNICEYIITQAPLSIAYENLQKARKQKIRYGLKM